MFNRSKAYREKRVTKEELAHMARVRQWPCLCCAQSGIVRRAVLHHIKSGTKRMGHFFVLPLCRGHHVGEFIAGEDYGHRYSVHRHHRNFVVTFGTERELWEDIQTLLQLPITRWPTTKILPRRIGGDRHVADTQGLVDGVSSLEADHPAAACDSPAVSRGGVPGAQGSDREKVRP